jgi:UDP-N-acetylmuramate dehydrogenase
MKFIDNLPKIRGKYRYNTKLGNICWFGVGGEADVLFIPADLQDLQSFLSNLSENINIIIIGVGSNLLIRDGGIRGVTIRLGAGFNYINSKDQIITAGSFTPDAIVAEYACNNQIGGFEFLSGIPGTIGGAVFMNAGAYDNEIKNILIEAKGVNRNGELITLNNDDMQYTYRKNGLLDFVIITEASFIGSISSATLIEQKIKSIKQNRTVTQPIKSKTGGSTFKNPPGLKAWEMIDIAGCRGLRIGGAVVSNQHCNFFINDSNATAEDLENLILIVQDKVFKKTGIMLEPEIKIIGEKL